VRRADLRLPGQRRVRDAQGRVRQRLARRARLRTGSIDQHQARRRRWRAHLFRPRRGALAARMKRYAVIGHPVAHSLSPRIHAAFAEQAGVAMTYAAIDAPDFDAALAAFDGDGANVTLPHKARAAVACASLGDRARRAGVANTLVRTPGGWHGDNTDGIGRVPQLAGRRGLDLRGRRALLLGAGGGARGVAPALLDAGIADLFIVNRSPERADALADALAEPGRVHPRYFDDLPALGEFDLVVNATSAGR